METVTITCYVCKDVLMPTNIFIMLIKLAEAGLTRAYINLDISFNCCIGDLLVAC